MQLIGYLDSPFVRRTAVSARFLGIDFEHRELSIWRDYDEFRGINPLVKVPTVHLHRNLNQKQHIFALRIAPATAVKLLDSITSSRIR